MCNLYHFVYIPIGYERQIFVTMKLLFSKKFVANNGKKSHEKQSKSKPTRHKRRRSNGIHSEFKCYNQDLVPFSFDRISNQYVSENNFPNIGLSYNNNANKPDHIYQQQFRYLNNGQQINSNLNSNGLTIKSANGFQFDGYNSLPFIGQTNHQTYRKRRKRVRIYYFDFDYSSL